MAEFNLHDIIYRKEDNKKFEIVFIEYGFGKNYYKLKNEDKLVITYLHKSDEEMQKEFYKMYKPSEVPGVTSIELQEVLENHSGFICEGKFEAIDCPVCSMSSAVNHPSHYTEGRKYEPIDVIRDWELGFDLGNALKYISRAGRKDKNKTIEDLEKAIFYIKDEIKYLGGN